MPFADYTGLKAEIAAWLDRTDLTAEIPTFIALAESGLNRALRTREQWTEQSMTVDAEYESLPANWAETSTLTLQTNPVDPVAYVTPETFGREKRLRPALGRPQVYTIVGKRFRFAPVPDTPYSALHEYWAKLVPLSAGAPTNWLLTDNPDVYLFAALAQANTYLRDAEGKVEAESVLAKLLAELAVMDKRADYPTTPQMRIRRPI